MTTGSIRITGVTITPVAFADPPLLNSVGVHEPFALRAVIEVATDAGLAGLGETYADEQHLAALHAAAEAITGADVYHTQEIYRRVQATRGAGHHDRVRAHRAQRGRPTGCSPRSRWPAWTSRARPPGRPVADLLGGAVRDSVPFSAYLFYKWAGHPGAPADDWGEALDPEGIVAQAKRMVDALRVHRAQAQGRRLPAGRGDRGDQGAARRLPRPPAAARPERRVGPSHGAARGQGAGRGAGVPGGPDAGHRGHGRGVQARADDAAGHQHVRGGLRPRGPGRPGQRRPGDPVRPPLLGRPAPLGQPRGDLRDVRPRAVDALQLAPRHQPGRDGAPGRGHTQPDLRLRHPLAVEEPRTWWRARRSRSAAASLSVPSGPGLGVDLDRDALARLHEQYVACGLRNRDDTGYMRSVVPDYERKQPRW